MTLGTETQRVIQMQNGLLKKLDMLEAHQGQVHDALASMEAFAQDLFDREANQRDPVDDRRLHVYDRAVSVSDDLCTCARCSPEPASFLCCCEPRVWGMLGQQAGAQANVEFIYLHSPDIDRVYQQNAGSSSRISSRRLEHGLLGPTVHVLCDES